MADGAHRSAEHRLRALTDFAKALTAARWSDDVLTIVAAEALRALDADSVSLSAWERESGWLRTLVNVGALGPHEQERPESELYPVTAYAQAWELLANGEGYVCGDGTDSRAGREVAALLRETRKASGLAVPVLVDGRIWGELWAARSPGREPFGAADLDFAGAVAVQVASGVAQAEHLARVERLAYTDGLTGLANRRVLEDQLEAAMAGHERDGTAVTIALVDLNDLKKINDVRGHDAGDAALRQVAHLLSRMVAELDLPDALAARLGGDEFCVLCPGGTTEVVVAAAERMTTRCRQMLSSGVSCGIASTGDLADRGLTASELLRIADAAQYRAKRARSPVPVVAGRHVGAPDTTEPQVRRRWRDSRAAHDPVLAAAADRLDALGPTDVRTRLTAAVAEICRLGDGSSWWLSRLDAGGERLFTVDSGVSRVPSSYRDDFRLFYDDDAGYPVGDYPASMRAAQGEVVLVEAEDALADPAEAALLALGGFTALVMCGGRDSTGASWLAEIFTDELSRPVRDYALAFRAAVALAITGATGG